jgi:hypothetical protein
MGMNVLLAALILVAASVAVPFMHCAVADAVLHLAAWIYCAHPAERAEQVEAWSRVLEEATPRERAAHAASFLWMAVRHLPSRRRYLRAPDDYVATVIFDDTRDQIIVDIIRPDGSPPEELVLNSRDELVALLEQQESGGRVRSNRKRRRRIKRQLPSAPDGW